MLAVIRPDEWNLPLLVHVLGSMMLVGTLIVAAATLMAAARRTEPGDTAVLSRFGFRALLIGAIPSYILMRGGAEWVSSKADFGDPDWIGIGYMTADFGLVILIAATVTAGLAASRIGRRGEGSGPSRWAPILTLVLIVAYAIAVWAMTAKPG